MKPKHLMAGHVVTTIHSMLPNVTHESCGSENHREFYYVAR